ncbi:MAG: hypothetical protein JW800_02590 [Candidatus Omnitrophica bacterium]|nr:hypothetical protein [Candidatus Omnitrophota bacterium]
MDKKTFEARLRQLFAADKNTHDIYVDLCASINNDKFKEKLSYMAQHEYHHVLLGNKIIKLLTWCKKD